MKEETVYYTLVVFFLILFVLDGFITLNGLNCGFTEFNPIFVFLFNLFPFLVLIYKLILTFLVAYLLYVGYNKNKWVAYGLVIIGIIYYFFTLIFNIIALVGWCS